MMNSFSHFLDQTVPFQSDSVQSYQYHEQKIWLKKAVKRHSPFLLLPMRLVVKLLGLQLLIPVLNYGGEKAIACEIQRLRELRSLGIPVPEILASRHDAFLLKDAAPTERPAIQLEQALSRQENTEQKLEVYQHAIEAIENIHQKNSYLSEAFARNILIDADHQFYFIDFETDPRKVLSLEECQIRDWLCFIFSTAQHFSEAELDQASILIADKLYEHTKIFQEICRIGRKLKWLLRLHPEHLGRDGQRMKQCIYLLEKLNQKEPLPMI